MRIICIDLCIAKDIQIETYQPLILYSLHVSIPMIYRKWTSNNIRSTLPCTRMFICLSAFNDWNLICVRHESVLEKTKRFGWILYIK